MAKRPGSLDDMPPWFHGIAFEIRTFIREGRADRKQAAEDRKQAAEDRKQAAVDRRRFDRTLAMIGRVARDFGTEQKKQTAILERTVTTLERHSGLLHEIVRAVRVRGNGQKGNGK